MRAGPAAHTAGSAHAWRELTPTTVPLPIQRGQRGVKDRGIIPVPSRFRGLNSNPTCPIYSCHVFFGSELHARTRLQRGHVI